MRHLRSRLLSTQVIFEPNPKAFMQEPPLDALGFRQHSRGFKTRISHVTPPPSRFDAWCPSEGSANEACQSDVSIAAVLLRNYLEGRGATCAGEAL